VVAAGGNARYHSASLEQKLALNGADPSLAKVADSEIKRYVGKDSNSMAANGLKKRDPARYNALCLLARVKGIL
jgi:hypothetical protein